MMKQNWIDNIKSKAKKYLLTFNKEKKHNIAPLQMYSFLAGLNYGIDAMMRENNILWEKAADISEINMLPFSNIIVRKKEVFSFRYSIQDTGNLTGFLLEVFKSSGAEFCVLDDFDLYNYSSGVDPYVQPPRSVSNGRDYSILMTGNAKSIFDAELIKRGVKSLDEFKTFKP